MKRKPDAVGLLLCEQIIVEEGTRNFTLVNCFTRRFVDEFPATGVPMVVVAVLTNGLGELSLEARVQRLDTLDEVYRVESRFRFDDPHRPIRCSVRLNRCTFPAPGHYEVSLVSDGDILAQRQFAIWEKESDA